jgi:hypothetical protein
VASFRTFTVDLMTMRGFEPFHILHRQIEEQTERLARLVRTGKRTEESRLVLQCLVESLAAIERSQAAIASDDQNRGTRQQRPPAYAESGDVSRDDIPAPELTRSRTDGN